MTQTHLHPYNNSHPHPRPSPQPTRSRSNSFRFPLPPGKQLRHIDTRISGYVNVNLNSRLPNIGITNSSEESLHLPIQVPSPVESRYAGRPHAHTEQAQSQSHWRSKPSQRDAGRPYAHTQQSQSQTHKLIRRKPVPNANTDVGRIDSPTLPPDAFPIAHLGRRDSDTLGSHDPYRHAEALKSSRVDLLRHKLVPQIYSSNAHVSQASQDKLNNINLRCEPDRSLRSQVSAEGESQAGLYQAPAQMPWLEQALHDPQARLQQVRYEQRSRRSERAVQRGVQPSQRLQSKQRSRAEAEYSMLREMQRDRAQLQYTQQRLNGQNANEAYQYPLPSRAGEDSVFDLFEREFQNRNNGKGRKLQSKKAKKANTPTYPQMVESRSGLVPLKVSGVQQPQREVSGWYGEKPKTSFGRRLRILLAKILHPRTNKWQHP